METDSECENGTAAYWKGERSLLISVRLPNISWALWGVFALFCFFFSFLSYLIRGTKAGKVRENQLITRSVWISQSHCGEYTEPASPATILGVFLLLYTNTVCIIFDGYYPNIICSFNLECTLVCKTFGGAEVTAALLAAGAWHSPWPFSSVASSALKAER